MARRERRRVVITRAPEPPHGNDGARVLAHVREKLGKQRAGGLVFRPSAPERRVLEWLEYESGADLEMDRDPRYTNAYELLASERPKVLEAIQDPASVIEGLSYPLDTGEVVDVLRRAGLEVDLAGSAIRRLADSFEIPQLGSGERRTFFARHVLEIASAILLEVKPQEVTELRRHLSLLLNDKEAVIAPMLPDRHILLIANMFLVEMEFSVDQLDTHRSARGARALGACPSRDVSVRPPALGCTRGVGRADGVRPSG